jgi:EAL domain-containing protein (putative c-di-GMP-specific phosphodiesterase class I)/GGDEF domain-containing protein
MSLSKQLLLFISLIFSIIFAINFIISINNVKSYLEGESITHMQDTATSLGLSISPYMVDENDPIIRTMMNAIFDTGYYKEMTLRDVDNNALITLTNPSQLEGVPNWLMSVMPMKTATASTEISSGWTISGTLSVTANPGYGYLKLYQQAKSTLKFSLLALAGAFMLLFIALHFTLKSLKSLEKQALDISEGNFTTIQRLPWTLEIKAVTIAMNSMSSKIGNMIARLNAKLEALNTSLKHDPLTKLQNQATYEEALKRDLISGTSGYTALVKFDDLSKISKEKGNKAVDDLLIEFSNVLRQPQFSECQSFRLYGSEFSLIMSNVDKKEAINTANKLTLAITTFAEKNQLVDIVHVGIVSYDRSTDFEKLAPAMLEAYEQARLIGENAFFIKEDTVSSMTDMEWKALINNVIESQSFDISFTTEAYSYKDSPPVKVMQEAFTLIKDASDNAIPVGTFFSMAEQFHLEQALDKVIINQIISLMEQNAQSNPVTINLSLNSICSNDFKHWLALRLKKTLIPNTYFAFSLTAYSVSKDIDAFTQFSIFAKSLGAQILLKRYSSDIISISKIKDIQPNYIRLARDLTENIEETSKKSHFLDLMHEVTSLLDIKVIAEAVTHDDDFELVKSSGIYGISR